MEDSKLDSLVALGDVPNIGAVSVKLPTFWAEQPKVWFAQAEAQFALRGISVDETKYYYLVAALDQQTAKRVVDLITKPSESDKYIVLKERLLSTFIQSPYRMAQALLDMSPLGDRTPSQLMDDMLALLGDHDPCILFRTLFVDALPQEVRPHLIPQLEVLAPRDLALLADHLVNTNPSGISLIQKKKLVVKDETPFPAKRWCRLHRKWGKKAYRCISPCSSDESPNFPKVHAVQGNWEDDHQ